MSASLHITTLQPVAFPLSANLYYHILEMENMGAGVRTQNTDVHILNTATWTNGVFRADNNHMLIFPDNATSTVAINASHADMRVRKIGNDAFNFPVGNAGWGAPIGISAPTNTTDHWGLDNIRIFLNPKPFTITITNQTAGGTVVGTSTTSSDTSSTSSSRFQPPIQPLLLKWSSLSWMARLIKCTEEGKSASIFTSHLYG
jgi:hypothetical protein